MKNDKKLIPPNPKPKEQVKKELAEKIKAQTTGSIIQK